MYGGHKIALSHSPLFCALGKNEIGAADPVVILPCIKQRKALELLQLQGFSCWH